MILLPASSYKEEEIIRYVVYKENTLGYLFVSGGNFYLGVIFGSGLKGGLDWKNGPEVLMASCLQELRRATKADFDEYRVSHMVVSPDEDEFRKWADTIDFEMLNAKRIFAYNNLGEFLRFFTEGFPARNELRELLLEKMEFDRLAEIKKAAHSACAGKKAEFYVPSPAESYKSRKEKMGMLQWFDYYIGRKIIEILCNNDWLIPSHRRQGINDFCIGYLDYYNKHDSARMRAGEMAAPNPY